jgi:hypothetical protein
MIFAKMMVDDQFWGGVMCCRIAENQKRAAYVAGNKECNQAFKSKMKSSQSIMQFFERGRNRITA